jgi:cytochrome c556
MLKGSTLAGALVMVIGAGMAASANDDPIESRQAIMKNVGAAMQVAGNMARGEAEFESRAALMALRTLNSSIIGFTQFFPEGSGEGDTRALPAIWENMDDFLSRADDLRVASAAAIEAEPQDLSSFQAVFGPVGQSCGACHEDYRRPQD